ncbi:PEP-CTERM/exosortase system-associated acyltransferase [uncultured Thiodictyon sp.]|uniref:PEP-CTERM/exosortase system-associated acyltransferase n=1 Tax=uncultured Thiodictyon sp. TaxID=1846217 RepID=UPI0025EBAAAD|nr:PEP-CTERM/exosortase system-associated acyltransferase [uncultured Thiodictyon sp.]
MTPITFASPRCGEQLPVFDRFVCILADTAAARRLHHQVRFKVFCEDTGFENPDAFPMQAEHDRYDPYARHFIVWDRQQRQCAGAMRLVDASRTRLPSEELVGTPLRGLAERRPHAVEFSRLCILKDYRQTVQAEQYGWYQPAGQSASDGYGALFRQFDNDVFLRLLRASLAWSPDIRYCYFIVTAALSRVLTRFGIALTRVGREIEHRGTRIPFRYDVEQADLGMRETLASFAAIAATSPAYLSASEFFSGDSDIFSGDSDSAVAAAPFHQAPVAISPSALSA